MDTGKMLDPFTLYEWFVVESRRVERSGRVVHLIHSRCLEAPEVKVVEQLYLPDGAMCESMRQRCSLLGMDKSVSSSFMALPLSFKFMAKVSPYMDADGSLHYHFMPTSFTMKRTDKVASKPSIDEVVSKVITDKVPYSDALKQLASLGSEYVKEYRKRMSSMGVKQ